MKLDDIKSKFSDLLRPNLYGVYILPKINFYDIGTDNVLGLLCDEASFPFHTINVDETFYDNKKIGIASGIDYDPATFSFYIDRDNISFGFFNAWRNQLIDENNRMGFYDSYISQIEIEIYDRQLQTSAIATLIDAYPININTLALSYADSDNVLKLQVSFRFKQIQYEFFKVEPQTKKDLIERPKTFRDFLTLGNIRRGVNTISKIKSYKRVIENGNFYDILANARRAKGTFSKTAAGLGGVDYIRRKTSIFDRSKSSSNNTPNDQKNRLVNKTKGMFDTNSRSPIPSLAQKAKSIFS